MRGKAEFTVVKGHDQIHQTLVMPRSNADMDNSREIFAVWAPNFDLSTEFLTDAQGLELMKRKVH